MLTSSFLLGLSCFGKWIIAGLAVMSTSIILLAVFIALAVAIIKTVEAVSSLFDRGLDTLPAGGGRVWRTLSGIGRFLQRHAGILFISPWVLVLLYVFSALVLENLFGCEQCLPTWAQSNCHGPPTADVQLARDRAEYERLKAAHGW